MPALRLLLALVPLVAIWLVHPPAASGQRVADELDVAAEDWPWWRGPERNGVSRSSQPPLHWSGTDNIVWKSPVPGRGHGSPAIVGQQVFLAAADEATGSQSLLSYERATGRLQWETQIHAQGAMRKNERSTGASSTPACDGQRVYISFPNNGAVYTTALTLQGRPVWQTKITDYVIHQGYGSSPALYRDLVLVSADNKGGGAVAALRRDTGELVWKHARPKTPNYPSPIVLHVGGRDQLLLTGCDLVTSLDPLTGEVLWETAGATTECVTSTVTDGTRVFSSGGYPRNHLAAILADGSGQLAWETKDRIYVPSLLYHEGHLYGVLDAGLAACWDSATGEEKWKARLDGNFSASPTLVQGLIYATNEIGVTFVFRADPQKFTRLAVNTLGEEVFATPTICGGRIYARVAERTEGQRREFLYCVGASQP